MTPRPASDAGVEVPRAFAIDDPHGLLKWQASDRCVLTLASAEALEAHETA